MRRATTCVGWVVVLLACVGLVDGTSIPRGLDVTRTRPLLDPTQAWMVGSSGPWSLWRTMDVRAGGRRVEPVMITRYYRQRFGSETAELVYESVEARAPVLQQVLSDGTVLVYENEALIRIDPRGVRERLEVPLPAVAVCGVAERGLLVQRQMQGKPGFARMFFVPFRDGGLDGASAVEVSGVAGVVRRPVLPVVSHGSELVWWDETGLHLLDVRTGAVRDPLAGLRVTHNPAAMSLNQIMAYDGRFLVTPRGALDLSSGRWIDTEHRMVLGVRGGVLYEVGGKGDTLVVTARSVVDGKAAKAQELARFQTYEVYLRGDGRMKLNLRGQQPVGHLVRDTVWVFDGKAWRALPCVGDGPG